MRIGSGDSDPRKYTEPSGLAGRRYFRLQSFRIHTRFWQFHNILQLTINPELNRKAVEIVIQTHPGRISREVLNHPGEPSMSSCGNRGSIERDAKVISHGLNSLVIATLEPGENRVTGEKV